MQSITKKERLPGDHVLTRETLARLANPVRGLMRRVEVLVRAVSGEAVRRAGVALSDLRRTGARRKRLRVVESLALGGRRQLLLVTCDEQEYLVGTGAESVEAIVLRQPGSKQGLAQGLAHDSSAPSSAALPEAAKRKHDGAARGGLLRRRDEEASGLWLVTRASGSLPENRIREADTGKGRELWR